MNCKFLRNCIFVITILPFAILSVSAKGGANITKRADEDVVLQWTRVLTETIQTPGAHPSATIFPIRSFAMMHAAIFDAVNSIDGSYKPYLTNVPGSKNASIEAAAAKAARDVLTFLYPSRELIYDAELAKSLEGIPENRARQGIRVGQIVARALIKVRSNDGWTATPPPYVLSLDPGNWQPTPPNFPVAGYTQFPAVLPFAIVSGSQFPSPPPPALTSMEYAADFNEVKELGAVNSATRTADQTQAARLHAGVGTTTQLWFVWNNVAGSISVARGTTVEKARLFALMNIAYHDTLQTTMTSKFDHGLWRPVTAIQRADEDGNPNTAQDAGWLPLLPTPPYPTYPGNLAAVGASQATILALFFGRDEIPFQHTWEGAGGATRSYPSLSAMAREQGDSRIYGGIHFRFDNVAGQSTGRNVANYVFLNFLTPRCEP
jgi:hypothetical protein